MEGTNAMIDETFKGFITRSLSMWETRDEINADFKELHQEVKDAGYSVQLFRQVVREQRMEPEARQTMLETLEDYRIKLGDLVGTPLGDAAEHARGNGADAR